MNYRLNIFGFLVDDKALGANSGDYGLQDQQFALRWVKDNVAAFGGDPSKVTTFGESAGGSSQCDLIASPTAEGLFEQAISVSGEYNTLLGYPTSLEPQDCKSSPPTKAQANAAGKNFAAAAGCGTGERQGRRDMPARFARGDRRIDRRWRGRAPRWLSERWSGHGRPDDQRHDADDEPASGTGDGARKPCAGDRRDRPGRGSRLLRKRGRIPRDDSRRVQQHWSTPSTARSRRRCWPSTR